MASETTERACEVCGVVVEHRQMADVLHTPGRLWWTAVPHPAPCGQGCMGGGLVRPTPEQFDSAHRRTYCGAKGCNGGRLV